MITGLQYRNIRFLIGISLATVLLAGIAVALPIEIFFYLIFAILACLILFVLVQHVEWIIYLLTIYIPFEEFIEKWIPRGLFYEGARFGPELLLIILLGLVLLEKAKRGFRWQSTPIDLSLILFLGIALISATLNSTPVIVGLLGIRPLIRYITIFYILSQLRVSRPFLRRWLILVFNVATIVAIIGLLQTVIGERLTNFLIAGDVIVDGVVVRLGLRHIISARTYIFSTMGRYDTLGNYLSLLLLIAFGLYFFSTGHWKKRVLRFLVIGLLAMLLTFSRQALLAFFVGLGVMAFLSKTRAVLTARMFYILGAILLPIFVIFLIPYAESFGGRVAEMSLTDRLLEPLSPRYIWVSRHSYGRLYVIFEVGPRIIALSPYFGFGPGQFGSLTAEYFGIDYGRLVDMPPEVTHFINDVNWVVVLGQVGLVGLLAFFSIFVALFRSSLRIYRISQDHIIKGLALGYMGCIIALLLLGFFGPNFEVRQVSFYFWSFGGMLMGSRHLISKTAPASN